MSILVIPSQNQKILTGVRARDADNNFYFISCEADPHAVNPRKTGKTYCTLRDDLTEDEKDEFLEDLENGDVTEKEAWEKTMPIGPAIAKIYGWEMVSETAAN